MDRVVGMGNPHKRFFKRWWHYLFFCPSFWSLKPAFRCPICGKTYRCYWDGYDVDGKGINLCKQCAESANLPHKENNNA